MALAWLLLGFPAKALPFPMPAPPRRSATSRHSDLKAPRPSVGKVVEARVPTAAVFKPPLHPSFWDERLASSKPKKSMKPMFSWHIACSSTVFATFPFMCWIHSALIFLLQNGDRKLQALSFASDQAKGRPCQVGLENKALVASAGMFLF